MIVIILELGCLGIIKRKFKYTFRTNKVCSCMLLKFVKYVHISHIYIETFLYH